jgi:predicted transcriptional regulator
MSRRGAREIPPPLELECLSVLWRMGESNVRTVQEALAPSRPLAYTTVMTMLERLARKHFVGRRKTGRHFVYVALVERDEVRRLAVSNLVDSLFDTSPHQLQAFLATDTGISPSRASAQHSGSDSDDNEQGDSDFDAVLL